MIKPQKSFLEKKDVIKKEYFAGVTIFEKIILSGQNELNSLNFSVY